MGLKGKKKDKHEFLMLYDDYRNSVLMSAAGHTLYTWDEIESGKYFVKNEPMTYLKHAHYHDDIFDCVSSTIESEYKQGIMLQRVPGIVCGGYEFDAVSYESRLAEITGYYDVVSRLKSSIDNGVSYCRGIPYTGKEIDLDSVRNIKHSVDVASANFTSIIDTVNPDGTVKESVDSIRKKQVYQAAFMLAYNGCQSICVLPCGAPYEMNGLTADQKVKYVSLVSRIMITLTSCVNEWHIYTAGIPQQVFAQVMYNELVSSGQA